LGLFFRTVLPYEGGAVDLFDDVAYLNSMVREPRVGRWVHVRPPVPRRARI